MIAFLARRAGQGALVLLAVSLLSFVMVRYLGDPVVNLMGPDASLTDRAHARERLGLDEPIPLQFVRFVGRTMTGNFGVSYSEGQDVRALIGERLPATLELALASLLIAAIGGVALGIYASIRPGGAASRAISGTVLLASSLPTFLVGILLIHLFAVQLRVLPSFGRGKVVEFGWWSTGLLTDSGRRALILPAITLAVFLLALIMRLVQAGMIEQLRSDHVRFARARGLSAFSVRVRHAFRNTLVPVIIALGLQAGVIISFSIVTETVFRWPGLGLLFVNAVRFADIPVISAYVLLVAVVFVASNLVADLAAARIDPRLRIGALRPASRDLPI